MTTQPEVPKMIRDFPAGAPRWLHVDAFDVELPSDFDPEAMDRFAVSLEVSVLSIKPDWKPKPIKDEDGNPTGRFFRSGTRWLITTRQVPGSPDVIDYQPAPKQMRLLDEPEQNEEDAA